MRNAIDHHPAGAADPLATIVIERDRLAATRDETFVYDIEHFQERHVRTDVLRVVREERTFSIGRRLSPHVQFKIH
jgi:hypothetical protein